MAVLLDRFVKSLAKSGLMTEREVQTYLDGLPPDERPETAEELAKLLYQKGKLTKFQTQAVYQGKTRGLVVGDYAVLDKIGQGGMGYVYKAQHRRMERIVALKVLPSAMMKSDEAVQRFLREVKAAAKLNHPNVVTAHDAREEDGVHFLVMEYVDGQDLASLVRSKGTLPVSQAMHYVTQAAKGLEYSHGQNVVHRDIKPSNLLVDGDGTVKILDMGLARFTEEPAGVAEAASLTHSGQVMGTIDYMSPEQAVDTHTADHRADVYSLGCTLYFLLTGRAVYGGDSLAARLLAHQSDPIPSLRTLRSDVPEAMDAIFRKMVAKRVDERHQSMGEVIADLEACTTGQQAFAETISLVTGPTGGGDTDPKSTTSAEPLDSALEHWLNEKLPEAPTRFRPSTNPLPMFSRRQLIAGSIVLTAVLALLVVFGIVIAVRTPQGTILVEVDQADAEVSVDDGKITLRSPDDDEPVTVEVVEGKHTLSVSKGGFRTYTQTFTIESRGREVFNVKLIPLVAAKTEGAKPKADMPEAKPERPQVSPPREPDAAAWTDILPADAPPPAVAPFDAATAKKHQEAWADYLGEAVEQHVDLADGVKLTMVLIPPGEFMMGSPEEEQARFLEEAQAAGDTYAIYWIPAEGPQHRVRITRPFRLSRHEVTLGQFRLFVQETGYQTDAERDGKGGHGRVDGEWVQDRRFVWNTDPGFPQTDDHPVVNLSWNDATAFCQWLSPFSQPEKAGVEYVLPTEAQWEYACRAGTTTAWHCGDRDTTLEEYAWFGVNADGTTHPVGQLKPNGWSLYDMYGNVREWCADRFAKDDYEQSPPNDPSGPTTGSLRVGRGGDWLDCPGYCRSALRISRSPDCRFIFLGFRVAAVLPDVAGAKPRLEERSTEVPRTTAGSTNAEPRVVRLDELNLGDCVNAYPWVSSDGMTIYWTREMGVPHDQAGIWQAERKDRRRPFENPRRILPGRHATFTDDGLHAVMLCGGPRFAFEGSVLCSARRRTVDDAFSEPQLIEGLKSQLDPKNPSLSGDGRRLVFQRWSAEGKPEFLVTIRETATDRWTEPEVLKMTPDSRFADSITWPHLSDDGLELWFCGGGIVRASRNTTQEPFGNYRFIQVGGSRSEGRRSPRYIPATNELFYSETVGGVRGGGLLWVVRNFNPVK